MPDIFGVDIAGLLYNALGASVFDLTLTKVSSGSRGANLTAGTNPSRTSYVVKGFVDQYTERQLSEGIVQKGDRKIIVLGASLPTGIVPAPNDEITDELGVVYTIVQDGVRRDPAGATYECQSR